VQEDYDVDLAVIGSGGAAMAAGITARHANASVVQVERAVIGGTCVNGAWCPRPGCRRQRDPADHRPPNDRSPVVPPRRRPRRNRPTNDRTTDAPVPRRHSTPPPPDPPPQRRRPARRRRPSRRHRPEPSHTHLQVPLCGTCNRHSADATAEDLTRTTGCNDTSLAAAWPSVEGVLGGPFVQTSSEPPLPPEVCTRPGEMSLVR
jgi:hypothetical protein